MFQEIMLSFPRALLLNMFAPDRAFQVSGADFKTDTTSIYDVIHHSLHIVLN